MSKLINIVLFVIAANVCLYGQQNSIRLAKKTIEDRGEVYFSFNPHDLSVPAVELAELLKVISVDEVKENKVIAYANDIGLNKFLEFDLDFEVLTPPSLLFGNDLINRNSSRDGNTWDYYPSWDEYLSIMNQFVEDYPDLCELVKIGSSTNGRDLLCIHINNNIGIDENEPEFLYTATIHGDEVAGYVLTLRLIDYLLSNYSEDQQVTNIVDNLDIWINPLANPDGTFASGNSSVVGATRFNANSVDLNRNYTDPEDGHNPDGNDYQVETIAFMNFAEARQFIMSSNLHGGIEVVNYPWDTWPRLHADDDWWKLVCREYADIVHDNSPSGYFDDLNNGITNGFAWYTISGSRQDYMNYFHNAREMTLELSTSKMPPESMLHNFWDYNYKSLLAYMEQCLYGFSGTVTDKRNGDPVNAKVVIENHDKDNSWINSDNITGYYHRPIKAGVYDVVFTAPGYYDKNETVVVEDYKNLKLNIELESIGSEIADFSSSATIIGKGSYIDFFDDSHYNDLISWDWTFNGGIPDKSSDSNPQGIVYNDTGEYDVTLTVGTADGETYTKTIEDYIDVMEPVLIGNKIVMASESVFYDTGGENESYDNDEDYVITFYPEVTNYAVEIDFIDFELQSQTDCLNDYLEIFDGDNLNSGYLGKWCGNDNPGKITATNPKGVLTVLFHSDDSVVSKGWKAIIRSDSSRLNDPQIVISPNPTNSQIKMTYIGEISTLEIMDITGRVLLSEKNVPDIFIHDMRKYGDGIYLINVKIDDNYLTRKVIVTK